MQVRWREAWRIIASRHPPIDLFERVAGENRAVSDAMIALEEFTNPRLRDEIGEIALVPKDKRINGPGASYVMAPFTHINPQGSRFADGSYGVYYAASKLGTAIAETIYHFEQFAADSNDPPRSEDMRVLVGKLSAELEDLSQENEHLRSRLLDPDDYSVSREWGRKLRDKGANESSIQAYASKRANALHCSGPMCRHSRSGTPPSIPLERRTRGSLLRL